MDSEVWKCELLGNKQNTPFFFGIVFFLILFCEIGILKILGSGEMAQRVKAPAVVSERPGVASAAHTVEEN